MKYDLDFALELVALLNDGKILPSPNYVDNWKETSNRISFHTKGIKPPFKIKKGHYEERIVPENWDEKYRRIVDYFILNRHPQEHEWSYQFRLSAFTNVTQEVALKALNQLQGAIFQKSNYAIRIDNEVANIFINDSNFNGQSFENYLKYDLFSELINDPNAFVCVIEAHDDYFDSTEQAKPVVKVISSESILSYKENEYLIAETSKGVLVLTKYSQFYLGVEEEKNKKKYFVKENTYVLHNFGELSALQLGGNKVTQGEEYYYESFFQPFVNWADLTMRNLSDHEVVIKNFSYPHKQVVLPKCNKCNGNGHIEKECDTGYCEEHCKRCDGKGTISINPGEIYVQDAPLPNQEFKQYDSVKFINPDVQILVQSNEHWRQYYDEANKSLFVDVKGQGANQSAESKEYDRQKFYTFCQNISQRLFYLARFILKYTSAYLNTTNADGQIAYDLSIPIFIREPKLFSNKNELDLINEYKTLTQNGSDRSLRIKAEIELAEKLYGADSIESKKIEILSNINPLYGYSVDEIVKMNAIGLITEEIQATNTYALMLLNNLVLKFGEEYIAKTDNLTLITLLKNEIKTILNESKKNNIINFTNE